MLALGHEVFDADGARFVRDRRLPDLWEANRVTAVTASSDAAIDRLLARAEREYADLGHRRFDLDFATPPAFEARLLLDGYQAREFLVMVLGGEWQGRAGAADIRPCTDAEAWAAYDALKRDDWRESAERLGLQQGGVGTQMIDSQRRRCPPARYWLAWALIRHGVAACRRAGSGPVVIVADADDTPRLAYSRMGFRAVAVSRAYLRQLSSSR